MLTDDEIDAIHDKLRAAYLLDPLIEYAAHMRDFARAIEQAALAAREQHQEGRWCKDLTCGKCYSADFRFKHAREQANDQHGRQGHGAAARCALGASSLESGNAREATRLTVDPSAQSGVEYTAGTVRDQRGFDSRTSDPSPEARPEAEPVAYGCHCDLETMPDGFVPDGCVIDDGIVDNCVYARRLVKEGKGRDDCGYWRPIKITARPAAPSPDAEDAARYRWLRSRFRVFGLNIDGQHGWCTTGDVGRIRGPSLDAAIDAERAKMGEA